MAVQPSINYPLDPRKKAGAFGQSYSAHLSISLSKLRCAIITPLQWVPCKSWDMGFQSKAQTHWIKEQQNISRDPRTAKLGTWRRASQMSMAGTLQLLHRMLCWLSFWCLFTPPSEHRRTHSKCCGCGYWIIEQTRKAVQSSRKQIPKQKIECVEWLLKLLYPIGHPACAGKLAACGNSE